MAKIKIIGYNDFIEVNNSSAKIAKSLWMDESVSDDTKIDFGTITCEKRMIKAINTDTEHKSDYKDPAKEFCEWRNKFVKYTSELKANYSSGSFRTFYWCVYNAYPSEELMAKAKIAAKEFYEKNPLRAKVETQVWYDVLGLDFDMIKKEMNRNFKDHFIDFALKGMIMLENGVSFDRAESKKEEEELVKIGIIS